MAPKCICKNNKWAPPVRGVRKGEYIEIYTPKLQKLDLTTDAEYVANLVNVSRPMRL